jgi:hypothetical protein
MAKTLCRTKYEEEVTREELSLLKQQMTSEQSLWPLPLELEHFPVQDESDVERQRRAAQYGDISRQAREKMLMLAVTCAQAQHSRCHKQHNDQVRQMWQEQRSTPIDRRLSQAMMDLVEQRFHNIDQRVQCLYMHKTRLCQSNVAQK